MRRALELGSFSVYRLASLSPFSNSTVYYAVEKLNRDGALRCGGGRCEADAGAYLAYYRAYGCDDVLVEAVKREFGQLDRDEICGFFASLADTRPGTWLELAAAALLRGVKSSLVAAIAAKYGMELDEIHRGVAVNGVFAGHCRRCGLVVTPCIKK